LQCRGFEKWQFSAKTPVFVRGKKAAKHRPKSRPGAIFFFRPADALELQNNEIRAPGANSPPPEPAWQQLGDLGDFKKTAEFWNFR
jgi:hypothetical protein